MPIQHEHIISLIQDQKFAEAETELKQAISHTPLDGQLWVMLRGDAFTTSQGLAAKQYLIAPGCLILKHNGSNQFIKRCNKWQKVITEMI